MKRFSTLTMLIGIGLLATGACGDDGDDDDTNAGKPRAGNAGRGGSASGAGGTAARAGKAGRGGSAGLSGKGGSEITTAGRSGRGGNGAGGEGQAGESRGGTGGSGIVIGGASGAGDGGTGGESGGPSCFGATAHGWGDITPSSGRGLYAKYASFFESSAFPGRDAVLELWTFLPDTGRFELGKDDNKNWATCMQCVIARVDDVGNPNRIFFADAGVLTIDDASEPIDGVIEANITNAHFVEVTVADTYPYASTPVDGGICLEGLTTHISIDPNAPPGGAGGAGGQGGAGGEGGYAGAFDLPDDCIEVSSGTWIFDLQPTYGLYLSAIGPNLGSSEQDLFALEFFGNAVGTTRIGHDVDSRFSTCERCFLANIPDNTSDGLWFFGVDGTLTVDAGSTPMSGTLSATATDVTLMQVNPYTLETPVENGACLHLTTATIALP